MPSLRLTNFPVNTQETNINNLKYVMQKHTYLGSELLNYTRNSFPRFTNLEKQIICQNLRVKNDA